MTTIESSPEIVAAVSSATVDADSPSWLDRFIDVFTSTDHKVIGRHYFVSGLVGPNSPEASRWETLWHYMQGGPGVFKGDLYFYQIDGDIRDRVAQIDTSRCPLYLLSGEYDYSCTPDETLAVAGSVKGPNIEATIMKGLGHFPMSENPAEFLQYLLPVLEKIGRTGA